MNDGFSTTDEIIPNCSIRRIIFLFFYARKIQAFFSIEADMQKAKTFIGFRLSHIF